MASVTLALPNVANGGTVEVDGLGIFANDETHELDDVIVQNYITQRANADGYAFRNGNGVTFNDVDEYLYPEEEPIEQVAPPTPPGLVLQLGNDGQPVDFDTMTIPQLKDYAKDKDITIPEGVRLKAEIAAFLKDGTLPDGVTND